jgi:hypothetical protein
MSRTDGSIREQHRGGEQKAGESEMQIGGEEHDY